MPKQDKHKNTHNMPQFQQMQYAFAAWIRKPDAAATPQNIERRRMNVYRELFLSNVKGFIDNAFPVAASALGQEAWQALTEMFFEKHLSTSPYFREIPQEFMAWLMDNYDIQQTLPPWLPELLHYEWLELHVSTLDADVPDVHTASTIQTNKPIVLSPFFEMAAYRWPVHEISAENQPTDMPAIPTLLAVYRTREHQVRFMKLEPKAAMLLEVLQTNPTLNPEQAAQQAALKTQGGRHAMTFGMSEFSTLFSDLNTRDILLGNAVEDIK